MADVLTKQQRQYCMSRISGKNTKPERMIGKALFSEGFRYKLHDGSLPGKPDFVFPKYGAVIFVNGCFWHGHDCQLFRWPGTNVDFWRNKIEKNREVDKRNLSLLKEEGWYTLVVWECALKGRGKLPLGEVIEKISHWLKREENDIEIKGV